MRLFYLLNVVLLFFVVNLLAQTQPPQTLWASRDNATTQLGPGFPTMSRSGSETSYGMVVDEDDNVFNVSTYFINDPGDPINSIPPSQDDAVAVYKFTNAQGSKDPTWNSGQPVSVWFKNASIQTYNSGPDKGIAVSNDGSVYILIRVENNGSSPIEMIYENNGITDTVYAFSDAKGIVLKLNANGVYQQHRSIRQISGNQFMLSCIETDKDGDVFVSGQFNGSLMFKKQNGGTAPDDYDYVLLGCDNSSTVGRFIFKLDGSNIWPEYGRVITSHTVTPDAPSTITSEDYSPVLISTDGNNIYVFWAQNISDLTDVKVRIDQSSSGTDSSALNLENCFSGGGKIFDGNLTSSRSTFLLKMNIDGNITTVEPLRAFRGSNSYYPMDIKALSDECYIAMHATSGVTYSHMITTTETERVFNFNILPSTVDRTSSIVVAKIDFSIAPTSAGSNPSHATTTEHAFGVSWIQTLFADVNSEIFYFYQPYGNALRLSADGTIYLANQFYSSFGGSNQLNSITYPKGILTSSNPSFPTSITAITAHTSGSVNQYQQDIIVAKIRDDNNSLDGSLIWGARIGGIGWEYTKGISSDSRSNLLIGGYFSGQTDLDPTSVTYQLIASQGYDAFVAKYGCWGANIDGENNGCVGEFSTLTAVPDCPACTYSYEWNDLSGGGTGTGTLYQYSGSLGVNRVELISNELSTGCESKDTIDITFNPTVLVTASPALATVCANVAGSFAASTSVSGVTTFNWYDFITGDFVGTGPSLSTATPGVYKIIANVNGCEGYQNVSLVNYPDVSPRIAPEDPTLCGAGGTILQVLDCPGCGFVWTAPPLSTAYSTANIIRADVTGTYQVGVLDQYGCTQNLFANLSNAPYLTPPIYATNADGDVLSSICQGQPLIIQSTPYTDCPTCSYLWSDGATGPYTFAFSNSNYNVTVTDLSTGCVGTSSNLSVLVSSLAQPIISLVPACVPMYSALVLESATIGCFLDSVAVGDEKRP